MSVEDVPKEAPLKNIGGFFEFESLEKWNSALFTASSYHPNALALNNGRSCLEVIIRLLNIKKIYVPFYTCNTLLLPLQDHHIAIEFYGLTPTFEPILPPDFVLSPDSAFLYINYWGLKGDTAEALGQQFEPGHFILDNTQAFFSPPIATGWTFYSPRKFFGVPDGGYLYPPSSLNPKNIDPTDLERVLACRKKRPEKINYEHLFLRKTPHTQEAYKAFQASEAQQSSTPTGMSRMSENILSKLDYEAIKQKRLQNYHQYQESLSPLNDFSIQPFTQDVLHTQENLTKPHPPIPFCFVFSPKEHSQGFHSFSKCISSNNSSPDTLLPGSPEALKASNAIRTKLAALGLFIPCLWPEVIFRENPKYWQGVKSTAWMFPLPVDHRYDTFDIQRVIDGIFKVFQGELQ
jgi:hypothetical protein